MKRKEPAPHVADFVRIDDDSFRVTCRTSGAVARLWPHYAWGGAHAIWGVEPPRNSECHNVEHVKPQALTKDRSREP